MKRSIFVLLLLFVASCGKSEPTLVPTVTPLPTAGPPQNSPTPPPTWTPKPTPTVWVTNTPTPMPAVTITTTLEVDLPVCDTEMFDLYVDVVAKLGSINASLRQQDFEEGAFQTGLAQLRQLQQESQDLPAPCDNAFWLRQMLASEIGIEINRLESAAERRREDALDPTLIDRLNISLDALRQEVERQEAGPVEATAVPASKFWDCSGNVYDCSYFFSQQEAQQAFEFCFPKAGDIHQLDEDGNGIACESLP